MNELLEPLKGIIPTAAALFIVSVLVPPFRLHLRNSGIVALGLSLSSVGPLHSDILLQTVSSIANTLIISLPLLILSEYVSTTARGVDLLRGALWAEQMAQEERQSPFETVAVLWLGTLLLSSENRFTFLDGIFRSAAPEFGSVHSLIREFGIAFNFAAHLLSPLIVSVVFIECAQGLLQRICRKGQFELSVVKLLLAFVTVLSFEL